MTQQNPLSEYLSQIHRIWKNVDYLVLAVVDSILDCLWYIDHSVLVKHKGLIDDICTRYHKKPNPIALSVDREKAEQFHQEKNGHGIQGKIDKRLRKQFGKRVPKDCFGGRDWRSCELTKYGMALFSKYVDSSLARCETLQNAVEVQWCEVIDFMFAHPEQINVQLLTESTVQQINAICLKWRKDNPLNEPFSKKLGKQWLDKNGRWQKERRSRI